MVRLKPRTINVSGCCALFQFLNGSIKANKIVPQMKLHPSFNSSMVRLKPVELTKIALQVIGFNSSMVRLKPEDLPSQRQRYPRFNSSMVRLKLYLMFLLPHTYLSFNSSMVRLKLDPHPSIVQYCLLFQFLNGSIKAPDQPKESL